MHLQPNLTSLIDVVFLLLVFFLLATQLVQEKRVKMELPSLDDRQSAELPRSSRVIVNVIPPELEAELGGAYQLDKSVFPGDAPGVRSLGEALARSRAENTAVRVLLRASRDEAYERVHPAMQAVTLAGIAQVDLVTVPPGGELQRLIESERAGGVR